MSKYIPQIWFLKKFSHWGFETLIKIKFLSAYSSFFLRIRRLPGKCLSVYIENGEFRVVCGTQSRLRIRGKNLCAHGDNAKRYKTGDILVVNGPTWKIFQILTFYTKWVGLSQKTISRYCPFKSLRWKNNRDKMYQGYPSLSLLEGGVENRQYLDEYFNDSMGTGRQLGDWYIKFFFFYSGGSLGTFQTACVVEKSYLFCFVVVTCKLYRRSKGFCNGRRNNLSGFRNFVLSLKFSGLERQPENGSTGTDSDLEKFNKNRRLRKTIRDSMQIL